MRAPPEIPMKEKKPVKRKDTKKKGKKKKLPEKATRKKSFTVKDEDVKYEWSIVTFIDIIGFKALVESNEAADIHEMLGRLRRFQKLEERIVGKERSNLKFTYLSDTIVRSIELKRVAKENYRTGVIFHELIEVLHMQLDAIISGFLLRGGITIGEVFVGESMIFGPGLIRAYELESKYAVYPRIVIDPVVLQGAEQISWLRASHHNVERELKFLRKLVTDRGDGIQFIDYLNSESEFGEPEEYLLFLKNHRDLIVNNAEKFRQIEKISAKYLWLAAYHNRQIDSLDSDALSDFGFSKDELRITNDHMPYYYTFPEEKQ